jgi:hypothetical protein
MMLEALALATDAARLPRYSVGDAFVFSDGRVERVMAVRGDTIRWAGLNGPQYLRHRNFIVPVLDWRSGRGQGKRRILGTPEALWPVTKTRTVRFRAVAETKVRATAGWRRAVTLWTCKSQKPTRITVPLGTYDTIPFACDRYSATSMRPIERLEWHYAPEVNHYIRRASVNYLRGTRVTINLVAALSGPAANRRRLAAIAKSARQAEPVAARPK